MEHHTAAENVGTNTFNDLVSFDTSSEKTLEGLRRSIRAFGPMASEEGYYSLVHACAETGRDALIRHFIWNGVNIDQPDESRRTPLHIAVEKGDEAMIKMLMENGADITALAKNREKARHWAARFGKINAMKALEELDEDPSSTNAVISEPGELVRSGEPKPATQMLGPNKPPPLPPRVRSNQNAEREKYVSIRSAGN